MKKVLIVEDDAIIANIYQRKLQMDGFQVQHAADGEIAMEMIKCSAPDIVLLDLQLPKANGIEVLKFIRAREESKLLPVVVFTNSYLGTMVQSAWKAGANKCLTKAICTPKQVADVLRATLAGEDSVGGPPPPDASSIRMATSAHPPAPAAPAAGPIKMVPLDAPTSAKADEPSKLSGLLKMTSPAKPAARAPQVPKTLAPAASKPSAGDIPLRLAGESGPIAMQIAPGEVKADSAAAEYNAPSEHTVLEVEANFRVFGELSG